MEALSQGFFISNFSSISLAVFKKSFNFFTIHGHGGHLGCWIPIDFADLKKLVQKTLPMQSSEKWLFKRFTIYGQRHAKTYVQAFSESGAISDKVHMVTVATTIDAGLHTWAQLFKSNDIVS